MASSLTGVGSWWFTRVGPALGLMLLLVAVILVHWVTPGLAQSPLVPGGGDPVTISSLGSITTLVDLGADGGGSPAPPIPVTRTRTVRGDATGAELAQGLGFNAAVTSTSDITVAADGQVIAEAEYRLAADRHTQALVDCCGAQVDGVPITAAGAGSPLRFPWFTLDEPYPYFDPTALAAVQLDPIGTEDVDGIQALKFQQSQSPIEVGSVEVPGRLAGSDAESAQLPRSYAVNRTLWVDPTTGIILREVERVRQTLRDESGRDVVTLVVMTTATTPEQVSQQVAQARREGRPVLWAHSYGPAICLVLGLLLLVAGTIGLVVRLRADRVSLEFPDEPASFDDLRHVFD